ncbi:putative glycosyl transferase [Poriferisphaera corsica]|uniref:Putative glycosyl transferase n=1 Tax=Poriferisphaera corsica TaxID=2528020 RepID=A0A517YPY4_9BACT|nr:glycosyltransferase family 4 protein [Poriferisphaera corsica]QDU32285.1 putative glycosyl transferase [Poriferisphaera corsica]
MRITILNQFYKPDISPTANLAASLAEHWAAKGHEVTVVASQGGYVEGADFAKSSLDHGVRVHRCWTPALGKKNLLSRAIDYGCFNLGAFLRALRLPKQDIIFSMTTPPWIGLAGNLHKMKSRQTKLALWFMDVHPEIGEVTGMQKPGGLISKVLRMFNRRIFNKLDHLAVLDPAMGDLLNKLYGHAGTKFGTTVIPNWEPMSKYPQNMDVKPWHKADELGLKDQFVILYTGNLGIVHQFDDLLALAQRIADLPVKFLINGGGKRMPVLKEAAARDGLSNFIFNGYVPFEELPAVMNSADLAYITLRNDCAGMASPSKVHANLAMGLPVLFSGPLKSNVDIAVTEHEAGLSVREGDVDGMERFVRELIADKKKLAMYQVNAREAFDKAYNDVATHEQFDELLDEMFAKTAAEPEAVAGAV